MARPLRVHLPGAAYHVCSRGNDKQCLFADDDDHHFFLELLARYLERFSVHCLAYCLLWNHFHLLLIPGEHPISRLMQQLNSKYCQRFNRKHGRVGHRVQGRPAAKIVGDTSYLLNAVRYIALNPVESGHVARPEDWRWSSYRSACGLEEMPPFLCLDRVWAALETADPAVGGERLKTFVEAADVGDGYREFDRTLVYGGRPLAQTVNPLLAPHREDADFTYLHRFATRPSLATVLDVPAGDQAAMDEAVRVAFCQHAYKLREIGELIGKKPPTVWAWIRRAERRRPAGSDLDHSETETIENRDLTPEAEGETPENNE